MTEPDGTETHGASSTTGRRVLFAWELGGGSGHIFHVAPLADGLADAGHVVTLAMRDVATTRGLLTERPHRLIQAPILPNPPASDRQLVSWADLLLNSGYTGTDALRLLITAWLAIFDQEQPDLLVAEFAPAAMLAARIVGLRVVTIGTGWTLPPSQTPLPSILPWLNIPPAILVEAETRALGSINATLIGLAARPLDSLGALFEATDRYLCCFPELDHYANRGEADYYGAIYHTDSGLEPEWPNTSGPRVFAYLSAGAARFRPMIEALGDLGWPAAIYAPNAVLPLIPDNIWASPGPVRLDPVLADRPLVICNGLNLTSAALVSGCPILSVPDQQEQLVLADRVMRQGLGQMLPPEADRVMIAASLRSLAEHQGISGRVGAFATAYAGYRPDMACEAIVQDILALLTSG